MKKKKSVFLLAALLIMAASVACSFAVPGKSAEIRAAGLLLCCLTLWITEAMPISISALLMLALLPFLDLMSFGDVLSNFGVNTALFIMASSGITAALSVSAIPRFLANQVIRRCGAHPRSLVIGISLLVAVFSAFVSSLATCALFASMISDMLRQSGIEPRKTNIGKDLMLVIPACAGIGGFMSPAGTPANILVMDLLGQHGIKITFLQWCAIGFPVGLLAALLFALSVIIVFKPEKNVAQIPEGKVRFEKKDIAVAVIMLTVVAGWFAGSFVPLLNPTVVALIGLAALFVTPFDLMDMPRFSKGVNWDLVLAMGSVSVLMTAVADTGLLSALAQSVFNSMGGMAPLVLLMIISLVICLFRAVIPTTTAVIALFAPMLISIAGATGLSLATLLLIASFWAASALLLIYTEPIYLIAYQKNYFTQKDLIKCGAVPSLLLCAAATCGIDALTRIVI